MNCDLDTQIGSGQNVWRIIQIQLPVESYGSDTKFLQCVHCEPDLEDMTFKAKAYPWVFESNCMKYDLNSSYTW